MEVKLQLNFSKFFLRFHSKFEVFHVSHAMLYQLLLLISNYTYIFPLSMKKFKNVFALGK